MRELFSKYKDVAGFLAIIITILVLLYAFFGPDACAGPYVEAGITYENGDTFGNDNKLVGVGRVGYEFYPGWSFEYEHHSNAMDQQDKNSYDALGLILRLNFGSGFTGACK